MEYLHQFLKNLGSTATATILFVAAGFLVFTLLERLFAFTTARKPGRAVWLDIQYVFLGLLYPPFVYFILAIIFGLLSIQPSLGPANPELPLSHFAQQLLGVLLARDVLIYIRHRFFHLRPVWAFHSIHHSSEEVDWLSAARFHPAENVIESAGEILLFLAAQQFAGVDPKVLSAAGLIMGSYNFFIHSNLRWTFGPLRYVFVSPVFHRWHHSDRAEAMDKNFAAMFSCLDLVLGTFYMPKDALPETLGLSTPEKAVHPRTFVRQLLYPFRRR